MNKALFYRENSVPSTVVKFCRLNNEASAVNTAASLGGGRFFEESGLFALSTHSPGD